jgi:biopolymer transport protein ExbD
MPAANAFRLGVVSLGVLAVTGCEPAEPPVSAAKPENIVIAVDKDGKFYWNDEPVTCAEISARFSAAAAKPAEAPKFDFCGPLDEPKQ